MGTLKESGQSKRLDTAVKLGKAGGSSNNEIRRYILTTTQSKIVAAKQWQTSM